MIISWSQWCEAGDVTFYSSGPVAWCCSLHRPHACLRPTATCAPKRTVLFLGLRAFASAKWMKKGPCVVTKEKKIIIFNRHDHILLRQRDTLSLSISWNHDNFWNHEHLFKLMHIFEIVNIFKIREHFRNFLNSWICKLEIIFEFSGYFSIHEHFWIGKTSKFMNPQTFYDLLNILFENSHFSNF
jgi:hypothetical protein